jgi:hypothetical protein
LSDQSINQQQNVQGDSMKLRKLLAALALVAMFLTVTLGAAAQTGGDKGKKSGKTTKTTKSTKSGKKGHKGGKKGHKGGKKSKKGSGSTTPPPK